MATFITDRTQADIDNTLNLFTKVGSTAWADLTPTEQSTYLSTDPTYEDRGRFSIASASRISEYMKDITEKLLNPEDGSPASLPATVGGRTVGSWGNRNFQTDPDFPNGTVKTFVVADVNTTTDEITITAHGITTGTWKRLKYTTDDTTLGGLTDGNYYTVYIKDANTISFLYGGIGTDITSKPASGTYTLEFITAPFMPISRDDFQYWVDILYVAWGGDTVGWSPINSPYLSLETLNKLEEQSEAILLGTITTITEYAGRYITNDEVLLFDDYI